ncbi:hypothetical protein [Arthrobacter sp. ISL-5]|uniref:hypothetical protein n=1 Tax=Arthrobacter sp. ISL-5 TaxID=2819111 RepID=UPI001BE81CC8|nr:hypothetical protein [Arthrobacter sp. ISL-5]MBT2553610.1 hypothetical protein [Arthrobacter sp. ISL-5]
MPIEPFRGAAPVLSTGTAAGLHALRSPAEPRLGACDPANTKASKMNESSVRRVVD